MIDPGGYITQKELMKFHVKCTSVCYRIRIEKGLISLSTMALNYIVKIAYELFFV